MTEHVQREPVPLDTFPPVISTGTREPSVIKTSDETQPEPSIENTPSEPSAFAPGQHTPTSLASKPTPRFIADLAQAIRAGAKPTAAAEWLGVPKRTYRAWLKRHGEPYDTLRSERAKALAHLEVRLTSEIAKKNPAQALRALRDERDSAPRTYTKHGLHVVAKALPYLAERVADPAIPDDALTVVEQAARGWRNDVLRDLGGAEQISATRRALLDATTGTLIILNALDATMFRLASERGLVNRRSHRALPLVHDRRQYADSLVRQLEALGLDKAKPGANALEQYVAAKYSSAPEITTEQDTQETPNA